MISIVYAFQSATHIADAKSLAGFVEQLEVPGEVDGSIYTFAGTLNEEQVTIARKSFGAYIRLLRLIDNS